ncbi:hypothetical protein Tco_0836830, partial [Tanacetum coccineum]
VLVHKTIGGVVDKLKFSEDFPILSIEFCDALNKEFLELFESHSCSSGSCCSDLNIDEDDDEFRIMLEEEEMLLFKEEKILEEESRVRLEEEARLMREEENYHIKQDMARVVPKKRSHFTGLTSSSWLKVSNKFKDKSQGSCDLSRCNTSIDNVWLSEDLDLYLGQSGLLRYRFTWCND